MSSNISVFNPLNVLNLNDLIKSNNDENGDDNDDQEVDEENSERDDKAPAEYQITKFTSKSNKYEQSPLISMISKHENGSLNLWDATFSPDTNFSQLLNISHRAR